MDLISLIAGYGAWSWIVGGLVLLALELVMPGGVFIWLGTSALITGGLTLLVAIFWPLQFVIYGVLALVGIWLWTRRRTRGMEQPSDRPYLNNRAERFLGHEAVLTEPIHDGFGRLALDDTVWRISGPDLATGSKVKVVGADGPGAAGDGGLGPSFSLPLAGRVAPLGPPGRSRARVGYVSRTEREGYPHPSSANSLALLAALPLPFGRSPHGLLTSNQSTGLICPAGRFEVPQG